jgi:CubicO group peptidase (beta-lactamase class C family)
MFGLLSPNGAAFGAVAATLALALGGGASPAPAVSAAGAVSPAPGVGPVPALSQERASLDAREVARFFDEAVRAQMDAQPLPGAIVVVVHRGRVLFQKGYGYADFAAGRPMDPEVSVLRAASVSKLFTATAVMQLVEQGKLRLDADVNEYLDFPVPATYPEPITLAHLLTHTAGFDERMLDAAAVQRPEELGTLRDDVTRRPPPRVRPPGQVISYSNYGSGLAGYVVERVSGLPFEGYVEENIFGPLGMLRSTFQDPPPARLEPHRVRGHQHDGEAFQVMPVTYEHTAPAGSLFTTGSDMGLFMLANLAQGELDGTRILGPGTASLMHAGAFRHHPRLPGWTLGFNEDLQNGRRLIGHGGDLDGAHSLLLLVPQEELGIFLHHNGEPPMTLSNEARTLMVEAFFDRFLPPVPGADPDAGMGSVGEPDPLLPFPASHPSEGVDVEGVRVEGNYRLTRHAVTSAEKLLFPASFFRLHVSPGDAQDRIRLTMPLGMMDPSEWSRVEPLLYRRVGGEELLAFGAADRGPASHLFGTFMVPLAFERVAWYEREVILLGLLVFSGLAFLATALGWPLGAAMRRVRRRPAPPVTAPQRRARLCARALGVTGTIILVVLGVMLVQAATALRTPLFPILPLLALGVVVCGVLTLLMGYFAAQAWKAGDASAPTRFAHGVLVLAGMAFVWQMAYWNVLAF